MVRLKRIVNLVKDTSTGAPFIVELVPSYTVQDELSGRIPNDGELAQLIVATLKEEVIKAVRDFTGWRRDKILDKVKGFLSADNGFDGKGFSTAVSLEALDVKHLLFAFENIQQSNDTVTIHDLEWNYQIDPNTIMSGGKAPDVPPTWANRRWYRETWKNQFHNGKEINCAAYALICLNSKKCNRPIPAKLAYTAKKAYLLQKELGWGSEVSFDELSKIVDLWSDKRVVLLDGCINTVKIHFTGKDYVPNGAKNILYLIHYQDFKKGVKHYAATKGAVDLRYKKNKAWCHACLIPYQRTTGHECDANVVEPYVYVKDKTKAVCRNCGLIGEHKCPLIQCRTCSVVYPKGTRYHRCAVELADRRGEKSMFHGDGNEQTAVCDGSFPAVLAYDLESVFVKTECSKEEIVGLVFDEDWRFDANAFASVERGHSYDRHKANLVFVRDVFTGQEWQWFGDDCLDQFLGFLSGYNDGNCQAWAHNGSGYDTRLIFEAVTKKFHLDPSKISQIMSGSRFMQLKVDKIVFRDSLRHLPGSLKSLAKDFCKDMLMKGDFPFMFNRVENYGYVGPIPGLEYFPVGNVRSDGDLKKLLDYHKSWEGREDWCFMDELVKYCKNDVLILADMLKKYHQICFDFSEQSPLGFVTGPGFVHSYCGNESFKQLCRDHEPPSVDDVEGYRDWIGRMAKENYWCVLSPYEHYFAANSLRGGRTENKAFRCILSEEDYQNGYRIGYTDVVSMYPSVQIDTQFPVGAPEIYVKDYAYWPCPEYHPNGFKCACLIKFKKAAFYRYGEVKVLDENMHDLVRRDDFFGIVCCSVTPPPDLIHPYFMQRDEVLEKNVGTLKFEDHQEIVVTSLELVEMLQYGYELADIHCYHKYHKGNFWKEPTLKLYLEKMLNSGPAPEMDVEKEEFVRPWKEKYGDEFAAMIEGSWGRWGKNPAMRKVFKIIMNSVWGKQAQRPVLPQSFLHSFKDSKEDIGIYFQNCDNDARRHMSTVMIGDEYMLNTCIDHKATPNLHGQYMPAACFVTAASRSKLYKEIYNLGSRALYMDTDSIIFKWKVGSGEYMPPEGTMVGEWETDGMIHEHGDIMEFVSFAPKTYGLKFRDGFTVIKAKGMSLSRATERQFNYDIMKEQVDLFLDGGNYEKLKVTQSGIAWNFKQGMKSVFSIKEIGIQPEHFKGDVKNGYIYPFGYRGWVDL
jgi:hypothetical protein